MKLSPDMIEQNNTAKRHIRNDLLFIVALLAVAAVVAIYLFVFRGTGDNVKVTVDGQLYGVYSLKQDIIEDIHTGADGSQLNRLIISDGKAYVEAATCPDGICAAHRPIFRDGESIVCLPHRVVITVATENTDNAPDTVA